MEANVERRPGEDRLESSLCSLRRHDHLCLIYDTPEEQYRAVVPFMRLGIEQHDRCFYVANTGTATAVAQALRGGGIQLEDQIRTGSFALATERETYLATGSFDPDAFLKYASGAAHQAVADGYRALRIAGEMSWALGGDPGSERIMEYEVLVNRILPDTPALAICQYDRSRFSSNVIRDVIRTHPLVVVGGRVCRNFYYVPPDELTGPDRHANDVDRLLANILERERAEDAVRESERRLALVLEGSQDAFWDWDLRAGRATYSARFSELLGQPAQETTEPLGTWQRHVHPDDLATATRALEDHLQGRSDRYQAEFRVRVPGGWRSVVARGRVVERTADGVAGRMAGIWTDVTERRVLQRKLETAGRLASIGTLAAGVAHEINNPLTFIASSLGFLQERLTGAAASGSVPPALAAELGQAVSEALDGSGRVQGIVRGLQSFAGPSRGDRRDAVNVREEILAAVTMARAQVASRAKLVVELPEVIPPVVAGANQIGQVVLNLLVNAAQAVPPGHVGENQVKIAVRQVGKRVVIEVTDTGSGIPAEVLPNIYDPFFTTKEVGEGTGLGLAICHGIVAAAGGTIDVESEPGRGTRFWVSLPSTDRNGVA